MNIIYIYGLPRFGKVKRTYDIRGSVCVFGSNKNWLRALCKYQSIERCNTIQVSSLQNPFTPPKNGNGDWEQYHKIYYDHGIITGVEGAQGAQGGLLSGNILLDLMFLSSKLEAE